MEYSHNHITVYDNKHIALYELERYTIDFSENRQVSIRGLEKDTGKIIELNFILDNYMIEEVEAGE